MSHTAAMSCTATINVAMANSRYHPLVTVVYFMPDALKAGGSYREFIGKVRQVEPVERKLVFLAANERSGGKEIGIDSILEIHGDLVDDMDEV